MLTDNSAAALILVVEDDDNHIDLIQRSFEDAEEEYRLEIAGTLLAAREVLKQRSPELVLTDYRLPDGDGNELVLMLSETCPVILMTSYGDEHSAVQAMKIGAMDYVVKSPEAFEKMPATVKYTLVSWALRVSRRKADDAARRSRQDWERTFDAVPDLIAIIGIDHRIIRANKAMASLCGLGQEELAGRKCYDVVHGMPDAPNCCPVAAMLRDGRVCSTELEEKKLGGTFEVTVSPLFGDDNSITAYVHVMRDITDRKKNEKLVMERLKLRDTAINSGVDELMQATLDACELLTDSSIGFFHIVDEDQQHLTLQTWSSNTLKNMCSADGHGSHYPISQAGVWVECFYTREPVIHNNYDMLPNRKGLPSGHAPMLRELTVPVVMDDKVVYILGVGNKATDYTEHDVYIIRQFVTFAIEVIGRKKAIIAMQASEKMHRKLANEQRIILNASSVGISLVKNRKVVWANPAHSMIFGYESESTRNMDTELLYADRKIYEHVGEKGYSIIAAGGIYTDDVLMRKKDGSQIWCNLVGQAVDHDKMDEGTIWIVQDITERKLAAEERHKMEQQFQQTQKLESLGVLSGGIAHDFNNILTVILGHCFMVKEDFDSGMTDKAHVEQIESAANRAADLCRQMLAYAGKSPLLMARVNMWLLVDDIVKMLKSAIKKNVSFEVKLEHAVPEICGDCSQIQQIVMNLIINAAEAIGDHNGTVGIRLTAQAVEADKPEVDYFNSNILPGRYVCLIVSDDGCGMDEKTQRRIFEPFFTTKFTGRGLGMSAILGIIKSHCGSLQMSSEPGIGTTFKVYLPLPSSTAFDLPTSAKSADIALCSGTVLLVDDEHALLAIGSALLNAMGFSVVTALDGRQALEIFENRQSEIDIVLLDLIMPKMDGLGTFRELRRISATVPVVVCSGYSVDNLPEDFKNDPYTAAVQKPYNLEQLRDVLVKYTETSR